MQDSAISAHSGRRSAGNWELYRRFLPLLRPYRRQLGVVLVATLARPILNTAKVWLLKIVIDNVIRGPQPDLLLGVCGAYLAITLAKGVASFLDDYVGGWVGTHVVRDLRLAVYDRLQHLSLRFYHDQRLGDLLTRLTGDISAMEDLLVSGIVNFLAHSLTTVLFMGVLFYLNAGLAMIALVLTPILLLASVGYARRTGKAQAALREQVSALTSTAEQGLSAIALVKAFAREPFEGTRFGRTAQGIATARLRSTRIQALFTPLVDLISTLGMVLVIWFGTQQVLDGTLSLGGLVVFLGYLGSLYTPIQGLSRLGGVWQRALVGAARVNELFTTPPAVQERRGGPALAPAGGLVEFRNVTFGYAADRPVLRGFNLTIHPGEMVALVGATGAGKTTAVSLLLAYYDPDVGQVTIDGQDLRDYDPPSIRRQITAVLQEPMLFQDTIRENLRYGDLDATDDEITAAACAAGADAFIRQLPDGYETPVGPRGTRLSGGQRQRLAIARALLKPAPVVILDEATSALDAVTERQVLDSLRHRLAGRAVLVVAHRLSTVQHADRIAVLSGGRVAELGTHEELLCSGPLYQEFFANQTGTPPNGRPAAPLRLAV